MIGERWAGWLDLFWLQNLGQDTQRKVIFIAFCRPFFCRFETSAEREKREFWGLNQNRSALK